MIVYLEQFVANGDVLEVGGVPVVGADEGPDAGGKEDHHGVGAAMGLVFALLIAFEFLPVLVVRGQTVDQGLESRVLRLISFGMRLGEGGGGGKVIVNKTRNSNKNCLNYINSTIILQGDSKRK